MSNEVVAEAEINAPIGTVWSLLSDVENYGQWSRIFSFVKARGEPGTWAILKARLAGPLAAFVPVRFDVIEHEREVRWHGGIGPIAHGSHYIKLEAIDDNTTRLIHGEEFSGIALDIGWPVIGKQLPGAYHAFNKEVQRKLAA